MMISLTTRNASDQSNLQSLAREMLQYASRQCPHIDQRTPLQKHKLIDQVNGQFQRQNAIIRAIGLQLNEILMEQANKRQALQETVDELNEQIQQKTIDMENLQEAATHLQNKVANYRDQYTKLKNFAQNLAESQKQAEKKWSEEKNRLHKEISQLKQIIHRNNELICRLSSQKELILAQFKQQRANIGRLTNQISQLQLSLEKEREKLRSQQAKCSQLAKQKEKLISKYQLSQQALNNVKKDVQFLKYGLSFQKTNANVEKPKPQKMVRHCSGQDISLRKKKIYWQQCQNLPYGAFNPFDWHRGNPQDKTDFKNGHPNFRCLSLDPYFAHFVLTSQSIKIKEDCEQLLNIDVKPYYNQIVEKRIPMHLWDQWIRNRLRELRRKIRKPASSQLTSQDDHSM